MPHHILFIRGYMWCHTIYYLIVHTCGATPYLTYSWILVVALNIFIIRACMLYHIIFSPFVHSWHVVPHRILLIRAYITRGAASYPTYSCIHVVQLNMFQSLPVHNAGITIFISSQYVYLIHYTSLVFHSTLPRNSYILASNVNLSCANLVEIPE